VVALPTDGGCDDLLRVNSGRAPVYRRITNPNEEE